MSLYGEIHDYEQEESECEECGQKFVNIIMFSTNLCSTCRELEG
jgi:ribosomal protein L37AE/L43A